jgi:hypothetical protein
MNLLRCRRRTSILIPEWKKKLEEAVSADNPNPIDEIEERTVN